MQTQERLVEARSSTAVDDARWILDLAKGWDDGEAFPIPEDTFLKMGEWVEGAFRAAWEHHLVALPEPEISPIPDGSIDVQWRQDGQLIAVNIPHDVAKVPSFYAISRSGARFGGSLDQSVLSWLTAWLMA